MRRLFILTVVAFAPLLAQAESTPAGAAVRVTADDISRFGIETVKLAPRQERLGVDAIIRVVDPGPLFSLDADLEAAAAAAASSGSELQRVEALARQDQSASQRAVQAARQQAVADASKLKLLKRRLTVEWGPQFDVLSAADLSALASAVVAGEAALVRADAPSRPAGVRGDAAISVAPNAPLVIASPLGFSGSVDPRIQTIGLFAVVRGDAAAPLRPGRAFSGEILTADLATGVVIPRSAIVRLDGADWAYVKTGDDTFERRQIAVPRQVLAGWFVTEGFAPDDIIAASGVGALIAIEQGDEAAEAD